MSSVNDVDDDDADADVPVWCPEGYPGGANDHAKDHTMWYSIKALSPGQELDSGDEARIYYWVNIPDTVQGFIQHEFFDSLNNQAMEMQLEDQEVLKEWKNGRSGLELHLLSSMRSKLILGSLSMT